MPLRCGRGESAFRTHRVTREFARDPSVHPRRLPSADALASVNLRGLLIDEAGAGDAVSATVHECLSPVKSADFGLKVRIQPCQAGRLRVHY